jgi:hypothetical protein
MTTPTATNRVAAVKDGRGAVDDRWPAAIARALGKEDTDEYG